ncbi:unnamed protein product, partial [Prorocentrum cordatum]
GLPRVAAEPSSPLCAALPCVLAALPLGSPAGGPPACERARLEELLRARAAAAPGRGGAVRPAGAGLRNIGNTCYLNSFLQALGLTESFAADLFALFPPLLGPGEASAGPPRQAAPQKGGAALQRALAQVLTRLAVGRRAFAPSALASLTPFGLGGKQQDVTELARWLFEKVGDAERDESLTARSFGGRACTVVRCEACGHRQEKRETFSDLCLP